MSKLSIVYVVVMYFVLLLAGIISLALKKDKCCYDERQELVRGRGFKYGFIAMCLANIGSVLLIDADPVILSSELASLTSIFVGLIVYIIYTVWNDAYVSVNQNPKKYLIFCGVIGLINIVEGYCTIKENGFDLTDRMPMGYINLLCGIMFAIMLLVVLVKTVVRRGEE